jgi:hypothetical protein
MNLRQTSAGLLLIVLCLGASAQTPTTKITVIGTLTRVMAIGGESTGWAVQFDTPKTVENKSVTSIEVKFSDPNQVEKYENKRVKVTGTVTHRHGVETGEVAVLVVTSIKGAKPLKATP